MYNDFKYNIIPQQNYSPVLGWSFAGSGIYLADEYVIDKVQIPNDINIDFVLIVSGDSMEPLYNNGEGFIKKKGIEKLISINPEYPNIELHDNQHIKCAGKVLRKL